MHTTNDDPPLAMEAGSPNAWSPVRASTEPSSENETSEDLIMMHVLWMLIVGLFAGAIAKLIMPGRDPGGILVTTLLGVAGSFLAGFLGRAVGWYATPGSGPGIIASIVGAFILLAIYRLAIGRGLGRHDRHSAA
jgi:uncharacterized membrane protein YeaQ/YmgE (transglycosylase-associated protein family)